MKASRRILTFLASLLAVGLIASAGLAVTRPLASTVSGEVATSETDAGTTCDEGGTPLTETDAPDETDGCQDEEGTGEEADPDPGDEDEPSPAEEDESGAVDTPEGEEAGVEATGGDDEPDAVDPIRQAACNEAAGVTPAPQDHAGDTTDLAAEKTRGLENAIAHVLANCASNPTAPGLLVALRHLVANKANHDMREEAKADAREKAKAKPSPHGGGTPPSQGTAPGNSGLHGNGGAPGHGNGNSNGGANGNGNAYGGGSPHGNPHDD